MAKGKYKSVVRAVTAHPWVIETQKLDAIRECLELRASGQKFSQDDIRARISVSSGLGMPQVAENGGEGVKIIPLRGVLAPRMNLMMQVSGGTSLQKFSARVQAAADDPAINTIVLAIDSPGGQVTMTPEAAAIVRAAAGKKKVISVVCGAMCSGAYWIGSAASQVVASPSSYIGSIGVVTIHTETSKQDEELGVTRTVLKAGSHKADGNDAEPLSDSARSAIQARIDDCYALFVGDVAKQRRVSTDRVLADFGQGQVFLANRALELGMIDRVGTLADVLADLGVTSVAKTQPAGTSSSLSRTSAGSPAVSLRESRNMDKELLAALVAAGLCEATANDAEATIALNAYFKVKGLAKPATVAEQIAALSAKPPATAPAAAIPSSESLADSQRRAQIEAGERNRAKEIRAAGQQLAHHGLPGEAIDHAVDSGLSVAAANTYFVSELSKVNTPIATNGPAAKGGQITAGAAQRDVVAGAIEEVLTHKALAQIQKKPTKALTGVAADLQFKSALTLAEKSLQSMGVRTEGMTPQDIAKNALKCDNPAMLMAMGPEASYNTTGSLPNIMLNVQNKIADLAFQEAPVTYPIWTSQLPSVQNFNPQNLINMSGSGNLPVVPEGDEFRQSKLTDKREWFQVDTYGDEEGLTFQMLMGDNLDFLGAVPMLKTVAAARTVNAACYLAFLSNPTMGEDSLALFHANHLNTIAGGSGGVPSVTQLAKMRSTLALQKGLDGKSKLRLPMAYLLVPVALQTVAEQLVGSPTDPAISNAAVINPFYGKGQVIADPDIDAVSATQWYAVTDKSIMRTVGVAFLTGQETPRVTSWWDEHRNTRWIKVELTFATVVANFRGIVQNAGS